MRKHLCASCSESYSTVMSVAALIAAVFSLSLLRVSCFISSAVLCIYIFCHGILALYIHRNLCLAGRQYSRDPFRSHQWSNWMPSCSISTCIFPFSQSDLPLSAHTIVLVSPLSFLCKISALHEISTLCLHFICIRRIHTTTPDPRERPLTLHRGIAAEHAEGTGTCSRDDGHRWTQAAEFW